MKWFRLVLIIIIIADSQELKISPHVHTIMENLAAIQDIVAVKPTDEDAPAEVLNVDK